MSACKQISRGLISVFCLLLISCGTRLDLAPVSDLSSWTFNPFKKTHRVVKGETLYAIAFGYDADYRQLAQLNHLRPPYALRIGQVLNLNGLVKKHNRAKRPQRITPFRKIERQKTPRLMYSTPKGRRGISGWYWPAEGKVVDFYFPNQGKKGIDIASSQGAKVYAALGGVVAYAGSGLPGYGNLIIIKHNNEFLTAYGNNSKNLVAEGHRVKPGQMIAQVGLVGHRYWGVHFEIRRRGKPVNPLIYLQRG